MKVSLGAVIFLFTISCTWERVSPQVDCSTSPIEVELLVSNEAECGASNGSFAVDATGGDAPYQYTSEAGSNTDGLFVNVKAGKYTVMATDAKGCSSEINVTIENLDGVNLAEVKVFDASCGSADGSIQVVAIGGIEPYVYGINGSNTQESSEFSNLPGGAYTVSVKDQLGCEITERVEISTDVSYENSIKGIIETNCAVSGCHNGSVAPDFRSFNNIQARAGAIKSRTANRSMPKGSSLSQNQIDKIACWVNDGALQN